MSKFWWFSSFWTLYIFEISYNFEGFPEISVIQLSEIPNLNSAIYRDNNDIIFKTITFNVNLSDKNLLLWIFKIKYSFWVTKPPISTIICAWIMKTLFLDVRLGVYQSQWLCLGPTSKVHETLIEKFHNSPMVFTQMEVSAVKKNANITDN